MSVWVVLLLITAWLVWGRSRELFVLSMRDGEALLVRGGCPRSVREDLIDVLRQEQVERARIRALLDGDHVQLEASGVSDRTAQRLRNVVRLARVLQIKQAKPPKERNLGQWLGVEWLAWAMHRS